MEKRKYNYDFINYLSTQSRGDNMLCKLKLPYYLLILLLLMILIHYILESPKIIDYF